MDVSSGVLGRGAPTGGLEDIAVGVDEAVRRGRARLRGNDHLGVAAASLDGEHLAGKAMALSVCVEHGLGEGEEVLEGSGVIHDYSISFRS